MKMEFDLKTFLDNLSSNPVVEAVNRLKKSELVEVSQHYHLDVKTAMKKAEIRQILVEHFVDENILPESVLETESDVQTGNVELGKLQLEYEMRLKEREVQIREKELETQVKMKEYELKIQELKSTRIQQPTLAFDVAKNIRLVPPFSEKDVDKYFVHFEKVAERCDWPKPVWTLLLQSVLRGKAQEAYSALSSEQSSDFDKVKQAVLKAYELVPEAYRQKFRNTRKK